MNEQEYQQKFAHQAALLVLTVFQDGRRNLSGISVESTQEEKYVEW